MFVFVLQCIKREKEDVREAPCKTSFLQTTCIKLKKY